MSAINAENVEFWRDVAKRMSRQRPSVGRRVAVVGGRKHKGKTGVVQRHLVSRFDDPFRYRDGASAHMCEMQGRAGYVCLVRDDQDGSSFWVRADYTTCLDDNDEPIPCEVYDGRCATHVHIACPASAPEKSE